MGISGAVPGGVPVKIMLAAIDLNHKVMFEAGEVHDET